MKEYKFFGGDYYEVKYNIDKYAKEGYEVEQMIQDTSAPEQHILVLMGKDVKEQKKKVSRAEQLEKKVYEAIKDKNYDCVWGLIDEGVVGDFIEYRKSIKKPLKTEKPIISFLNELEKICQAGFDVKKAIETMKEREWQTLKLEYIDNTIGKGVGADDRAFM